MILLLELRVTHIGLAVLTPVLWLCDSVSRANLLCDSEAGLTVDFQYSDMLKMQGKSILGHR